MFQLRPEHLGIDSEASGAIAVLNSWREQSPLFETANFALNAESLQTLPADWLTEPQRQQMLSKEFRLGDAIYIRNALMTSAAARTATEGTTAELDRVLALFDSTMQMVILQPAAVPQLPFPLYELMLLGQGTPDDRAWVFAALLKQQRIDAVVLQSKDDPEAKLTGVILDGEVYLFDCRLGLPIPRGDDPPSPRITRPATMREMLAHPDWWEALTIRADQPYAWNTDALNQADVFVIAEEESWSGRMKQLETVLPADSACVLYDPLVDTPALPLLAKRIAAANPDWTPDRLKFWPHPLNLAERTQKLGEQIRQLQFVFQRVRVPLEVMKEKKEKLALTQDELLGKVNPFRDDSLDQGVGQFTQIQPTDAHWKARVEMLLGRYDAATTQFLRIRHLALDTPPAELRGNPQEFQVWSQLYQAAAADASFWSAVCKIEQGDNATGVSALQDYLKRYSRSNWASGARYLQALTSARLNQLTDARAALAGLLPDDPHRPGLEVLSKRWDRADDARPKTPAEKREEKSENNPDEPATP